MPKKIDPKVKERCVRQVLEHLPEYPSLTAAGEAMARREGLGKETVRRWVVQAQIDGEQRQGTTSEELAEIKELKAKVRRLEEDNEILRRASIFAGELCATRRCVCRGAVRDRPRWVVVAAW
jgi:transposase